MNYYSNILVCLYIATHVADCMLHVRNFQRSILRLAVVAVKLLAF